MFGTMPEFDRVHQGRQSCAPLAVTTATRSEALPDMPTVGDFVPGYEASGWHGLGAPKGHARRNRREAQQGDQRRPRRSEDQGALRRPRSRAMPMTPAEFGKLIADGNREVGQGDPGGQYQALEVGNAPIIPFHAYRWEHPMKTSLSLRHDSSRRPGQWTKLDGRHPDRQRDAAVPRRRFLHLAAGAAALPAVSRIARAQAYPSRPITMIVPFAAGGPPT